MPEEIKDYKDYGYEVYKGGLFWETYIYKKIVKSEYKLVDVLRFLVKPTREKIHKNIDQKVLQSTMSQM
ncbi:hypothetical protein V7O62_02415 [Methanolobus sp. ZRKC2]|uniref:hypothetical protein n=1 Tax=Methanolobus sp. ZRKC2 TaxID=3125783 RepID=UPI00324F0C00